MAWVSNAAMTMTFRNLALIIEFTYLLVMAGMFAAITLMLWAMALMFVLADMIA